MEPRSVKNSVTIGGSSTGPIIQSGGSVRITGGIGVNGQPDTRAELAAAIDEVRRMFAEYSGQVPRRAMTDLSLGQIAAEVREPGPDSASVVGALWGDLAPELAGLAESMTGLAGLKPRLAAITEGLKRL